MHICRTYSDAMKQFLDADDRRLKMHENMVNLENFKEESFVRKCKEENEQEYNKAKAEELKAKAKM